jgi:hypothetical protein
VTPWSAKPGLGTPDGLPFQTIPGAATLWWQARRVVRSVRLPEPRNRDCGCGAYVFRAGPEDHAFDCRGRLLEESRQAAIAAARGGAR